ncbi:hypothetical protein EV356DRAFT_151822 [Viridothelium virens]|uniref:Uncharacterized protein n=1 Tax=Viridothelium virens TaxID=1048519 RepID=A0A6A6H8M3_VIRVR|nr:hypothetical protein EV356DRAFT_151822 [Viridothelium virens]
MSRFCLGTLERILTTSVFEYSPFHHSQLSLGFAVAIIAFSSISHRGTVSTFDSLNICMSLQPWLHASPPSPTRLSASLTPPLGTSATRAWARPRQIAPCLST